MKILKQIIAATCLAAAASAYADPIAEWKFDGKTDVGPSQSIPLDTHAPTASGTSILMSQTSYACAATGISNKWQEFLSHGYLDIGQGEGKASINLFGLVTKSDSESETARHPLAGNASYASYFGFTGLGAGSQGGTVYLVISPKAWDTGRVSLFGTGHVGGQVNLSLDKGIMTFAAGMGPGKDRIRATATLTQIWTPDKWYFIAGSWSGGQNPVLYVREMDPAGPKTSPKATAGAISGSIPLLDQQPHYDPFVIGSVWIDSGGPDSQYTWGGANAKIAYARIDNVYSSPETIESVFNTLAAP